MIRYPRFFSQSFAQTALSGAAVAVPVLAAPLSLLLILLAPLLLASLFASPASAQDQTLLTRAVITALRKQVHLKSQAQLLRPAQLRDALQPGDTVATSGASLAELRFNDGTLARMGERAVFRFLPQTRTVRLSQGTLLLLIPPGRGRTQVVTPNVLTGIRGSALFVRYNPETNTTLVGALTTSGIEVTTTEGAPLQVLEAGQMAVVVDDQIERLYEFDLAMFYETSRLVEGLNLDRPMPRIDELAPEDTLENTPELGPRTVPGAQAGSESEVGSVDETMLDHEAAIAAVRQEIWDGLVTQSRSVQEHPGEFQTAEFVRLSADDLSMEERERLWVLDPSQEQVSGAMGLSSAGAIAPVVDLRLTDAIPTVTSTATSTDATSVNSVTDAAGANPSEPPSVSLPAAVPVAPLELPPAISPAISPAIPPAIPPDVPVVVEVPAAAPPDVVPTIPPVVSDPGGSNGIPSVSPSDLIDGGVTGKLQPPAAAPPEAVPPESLAPQTIISDIAAPVIDPVLLPAVPPVEPPPRPTTRD
ncbi:MAG: FecR domain-containing protein [Synechococcales cyanobacterium CRU_2_2]|nr:FecR domain-containing protein [Synechococcales cyanobacterium CRU_2_2]